MNIKEVYEQIEKYNSDINNKLREFINRCLNFEKYYNHKYELQKTLKLNKTFFQCYISESDVCYFLKEYNHTESSLEELKKIMKNYEKNSGTNLGSYYEAIDLCQMVDDIEELVDKKIEYEMTKVYRYSKLIKEIEDINSDKYQELCERIKNDIVKNQFNKGLIDNSTMHIIGQMLNEIFNYFISGYPVIPDEFLNNNVVTE